MISPSADPGDLQARFEEGGTQEHMLIVLEQLAPEQRTALGELHASGSRMRAPHLAIDKLGYEGRQLHARDRSDVAGQLELDVIAWPVDRRP